VRPRSLDELLRETETALRAWADRRAVLTFRRMAAPHRDPNRFQARIVEAERDLEQARGGVLRLAKELEAMGVADTASQLREEVQSRPPEAIS
jgi:hypothetical protein